MRTPKLFGLTAVILSLIAVGCAPKSASDQALVTEIQSKLYADDTTKQASVKVAAKDGVVTLSGDVPSSNVELQAMKIANGTAGVRSVDDQMKVNGSAAANQPPVAAPNLPGNSLVNPSTTTKPTTSRSAAVSQPAPIMPVPSAAPPRETAAALPPPPRPAEPSQVTIPAGDRLSVRTTDAIDSGKASVGQTFRASLEAPLVSDGRVIVPAGAPVTLEIQSVRGAGRIKGNSELTVRPTSIQYRGRAYPVESSAYADEGKARGKQTAVKTGAGAAVGAIIGAIAGGGKGAAIGSAAGGGAGFGWNALTHGQQVKIPSETVLSFKLESALTVPVSR